MNVDQLNTLCAAYGNVDGLSIHTASGVDSSNRIGDVVAVSWSPPSAGAMSASVTFPGVTGEPKFLRAWDGAVFVEEFPINNGRGVQIVDQDLTVVLQHRVKA
ncbi:MAG: hypothetical protein M0Q49_04580 [Porticoccaceae bacterium]|nr:hypothetical protein [Porticoccaceae bacterium]